MASSVLLVTAAAAAYYMYRSWWSAEPATPHKKEKYYQHLLHLHVGGRREVRCRYGFVDVLTNDAIYEVKKWATHKQIVGQIWGYKQCFPGRRCVAVLFGKPYQDRKKKRDVVQMMKQNGIEVWMCDQQDVLFEL